MPRKPRLFVPHIANYMRLKGTDPFIQTGTPLGSSRFIEQIEVQLKVKVGYSKRGRPGKASN